MSLSDYTFTDLVNIKQLTKLFENFSAATGFTTGLVDQRSNKVLIGTGWRDICHHFHRANPDSELHCQASNRKLTEDLHTPGEIRISHCENGLVDGCTPIIIDGHHLANLYTGQILFAPPAPQQFSDQAQRFGYDKDLYIAALKGVPVVDEAHFKAMLRHLAGIAVIVAETGLSRLREAMAKEKYQEIFNTPHDAIFIHDAVNGDILDVNNGMLEMFKCSREEALQTDAGELSSGIPPFTNSDAEKKIAAAIQSGSQRFDWQSKRMNGELFWADVLLKPVQFGGKAYIIASARDISDRKAAEEAIRSAKQAWESTFDAVPDLICLIDHNHTIFQINQAMADYVGMSKEEAIGKPCHQIVHATSCPPKGCPHSLHLSDKQHHETEIYDKHRDTYLHISVVPLIDKAGNRGCVHIARDITAQKKAALTLHAEKERLAVTLKSIGDGVIITDLEGKIVSLNRVAEDLTGWSDVKASGINSSEVFNIINEKTGVQCASPVQKVLEVGKPIGLAHHTALIAKDGRIRSIADSGAPIRDALSKVIGVVIVFRDVTNEKRLEEELLKIRKLESVGVLAGGIAHDFNNILSAILGNTELAVRLIRESEPQAASLLTEAMRATNRASKLTNQLLTFAKGGEPVKETASLCEIVQESSDFILRGSRISCEHQCDPNSDWPVEVDSGQISQVIQNIILNSKHAMPEGGKILVNCSNVTDTAAEALLGTDEGSFVRITIHDSGIGIPKHILDKVFDPYFSTKQEGSGLGLAVCHSIINKHDGYMTVQSPPGDGTTFTIYLPASEKTRLDLPVKTVSQSAVKAARIIVMDDDKMVRDLIQSQLEILGHEVFLVSDGEQAITCYRELQDKKNPADLLIVDLTIPGGMGGKETAEKLLTLDPQARLIVTSGYSNDPILANYRDHGFVAAVAKPFDLSVLSRAITKALN